VLRADRALDTDPQVVALLETLIAEIRGLRGDLARDRRPRRALSRADVDRLSRLLPALAGCFGSEPFIVAEAFAQPAVRVVTAGLAPPACGQLLQRARGIPIAGYVVTYDATELHRRVWRLEATV
jgi:hypothetical protein